MEWHDATNLRWEANSHSLLDGFAADCPAHGIVAASVDESDTDVVFVHGYNMAPREARAWAQAMFKRLWRMGMNARFTAVTWRGNETQVFIP